MSEDVFLAHKCKAVIACGDCVYCSNEMFGLCEKSNPEGKVSTAYRRNITYTLDCTPWHIWLHRARGWI